jgi:MFS family permease
MQIAAIIGFILGCFTGGYLADVITAAVIRRQNGKVYPEQRLISLIPGCAIGPAGCILIAFACSEKLHWVSIAFGFGMGKQSAV